MTRDELISALESAECGSREMDIQIAMSLEDVGCTPFKEYAGMYWAHRERRQTDSAGKTWVEDKTGVTAPHYTTNLQDTLSLVREGWRTTYAGQDWNGEWSWILEQPTDEGDYANPCVGKGKTPQLALASACIKAMERDDERTS